MIASAKWEPREMLHKLQDEINRGFEDVLGLTPSGLATSLTHWRPRVDLSETDTHLIAEFDLPGVRPEGIHLAILGKVLTLKAEPRVSGGEEGVSYLRRERYRKKWMREIELPSAVDPETAEARYEHGILTVRLTKVSPQAEAGKQIPVS